MPVPSRTALAAFGAGLLLVAAIPFAARPLRRDAALRCAFDGVAIDARHVVRITDAHADAERRFCCVDCGAAWLALEPPMSRRVFVVDEQGGGEIEARNAWFVRSSVIAVHATASRIHCFASESAARQHAEAFRGALLAGDSLPFPASH